MVTQERSVKAGRRNTPPLQELGRILQTSQALERSEETLEDLRCLLGKGTSLGGIRPKCTLVEEDGSLAIGPLPSVGGSVV